jgi:hypothetical protein
VHGPDAVVDAATVPVDTAPEAPEDCVVELSAFGAFVVEHAAPASEAARTTHPRVRRPAAIRRQ